MTDVLVRGGGSPKKEILLKDPYYCSGARGNAFSVFLSRGGVSFLVQMGVFMIVSNALILNDNYGFRLDDLKRFCPMK